VKIAYRRFCQGVKVAVEMAMIVAQEGYITGDKDIISVGKWDTALIIKPSINTRFEDL